MGGSECWRDEVRFIVRVFDVFEFMESFLF